MTDAEMIADLQRLHEAATPGEWSTQYLWPGSHSQEQTDVNCALIVATINALPRLLEIALANSNGQYITGTEAARDNAYHKMERERDALAARVAELEDLRDRHGMLDVIQTLRIAQLEAALQSIPRCDQCFAHDVARAALDKP